jgi:hypothetical protein
VAGELTTSDLRRFCIREHVRVTFAGVLLCDDSFAPADGFEIEQPGSGGARRVSRQELERPAGEFRAAPKTSNR